MKLVPILSLCFLLVGFACAAPAREQAVSNKRSAVNELAELQEFLPQLENLQLDEEEPDQATIEELLSYLQQEEPEKRAKIVKQVRHIKKVVKHIKKELKHANKAYNRMKGKTTEGSLPTKHPGQDLTPTRNSAGNGAASPLTTEATVKELMSYLQQEE